jgi:hypothetical protein
LLPTTAARTRFGVGFGQEAGDGSVEVGDGAEQATLEAPPGELGEKAFDGVEPRRSSRREVEVQRGCRANHSRTLDLRIHVTS